MPEIERRFAVFDIDGTLIRWQLYHAIVGELAQRNHLSHNAEKVIQKARMTWKQRKHENSFKDYERTLIEVYYETLQDVSFAAYESAIETVFSEYKDQVYTYTRDLVHGLKKSGFVLLAISGSHYEIVKKLAAYYGFDDAVGTSYIVKNGKFTGEERGHLHKKHIALSKFIDKYGLTLEGSVAVGDSEGDISMLEMVENPIAFNPTKGLLKHARENGWKVVVERKNVIYELEPDKDQYKLSS